MITDIDGLADAVAESLQEYNDEVCAEVKEAVKEISKECLSEIKANSPKNQGKYKKGWRLKVEYDRKNDTRVTIHNKTRYQLTHLLEHGHAKAGGGRVEGKPHISPAEKRATEKLLKRIEAIVKK